MVAKIELAAMVTVEARPFAADGRRVVAVGRFAVVAAPVAAVVVVLKAAAVIYLVFNDK